MSADRGEFYRERDRAILGDAMFEHCERIGRAAPAPGPEQVALIGRIFGPPLRRIAQRDAVQQPAQAA